jgi:hypothetical protein
MKMGGKVRGLLVAFAVVGVLVRHSRKKRLPPLSRRRRRTR